MKSQGKEIEFIDKTRSRIKTTKEIVKIVKNRCAEALYVHFGFLLNAEMISLFHPSIKVFIHIHSDFSAGNKGFKEKIHDFILYKILSVKSKFLCVSKDFLKLCPKRAVHIPNGLADERVACYHTYGKVFREINGVYDDDVLLEIFGWSPYVKGVDIAVNAVKRIYDSGIKIKLLIVCGRSVTEEEMKHFISNNSACTGDEDWLLLVSPTEDVYCYHEAADIHLSASRSEGFPYSVLEMLSLGKRCIISNIPGTSWAKSYDNVTTFQSGNSDSCAHAILDSLNLPSLNSKVADQVKNDYSIDNWVNRVINELELL